MSNSRKGSQRRGARAPRLLIPLLRMPLFYKIVIANAALYAAGATLFIAVTVRMIGTATNGSIIEFVLPYALLGLVAVVAVNAFLVRLALKPLEQIERVTLRLREQDWTARIPRSRLADRNLDRLSRLFNRMLDDMTWYRDRLRHLASAVLRAQEDERTRISRELHDGTAQRLTALMVQLRVAQQAPNADEHNRLLGELREAIADTLEDVRSIARGLRPPALDDLGLAAAIERHAAELEGTAGIPIRVDVSALTQLRRPIEIDVALYRIAQEAISNALRHAAPTLVVVRALVESGRIGLEVEDDGRGFDVDETIRSGRGLGIVGMLERASTLGGRVDFVSHAGRGTSLRALVPIEGPSPGLSEAAIAYGHGLVSSTK